MTASPSASIAFTEPARARTMRLSLLEALFYAVMVGGGEGYFLADAVRLHASAVQLGLVVSLPLFVGGLGPLLALRFTGRGHRKPLVVAGAAVQSLSLAALALADALNWLGPLGLIAIVCIHQACGQAGGTAWSAWISAVVPTTERGRYFARRSRRVQVATMVTLLAAGLCLHQLEPGAAGNVAAGEGGMGFVVAFGLAAVARAISCVLLALSPEPPPEAEAQRFKLQTLLRDPQALNARRVLGVGAALQLAVYLASPYFGPFMLEHLHLSYVAYTIGNLAVVATKVTSLKSWGHVVDTYNPRSVFLLAAFLIAVIPLPWLWADGLLWVVVAQALSGFAWGGHEIAHMALSLDTAPRAARQHMFAAQSFLQGCAQLLGTLVGGVLLGWVDGRFWLLFLASTVARLGVALWAPKWLAHVESPAESRHVLLLRVIGLRASGGLVHRPIGLGDTPPPELKPPRPEPSRSV